MNNLTAADVDADITMLMDSFNIHKRSIPSLGLLMRRSAVVPCFSLFFSAISTVIFYLSTDNSAASISGFFDFFMSEGWYLVAATLAVGLFFSFMTYNTLLTYMAFPAETREKSIIFRHLMSITRKTVFIFFGLIVVSCILSGLSPWFTVAIPALTLALFIVVNVIVGLEISRLGIGAFLQKMSALIKKI
ncbi:hypothetical protein [Erwinia persicina]|uniref:Conjugal transfer protein TraS n=1 Tax=Erwinia persicina TaxID=55211 RepID=A0ABR9A045_9GAMM|nr:hypothetical protein [Erwinia persicina]MBD8109352.1 hypothetical protein [Erwinia persicina]MBD8170034.1 hypothetical protein [Erwinia persicina]MBD8212509.1 hypothetical protein [Erwinia persicina]